MRSAPALASALLLAAVLPLASARTCWGFDGQSWENNELCAGSQTCCGVNGTCLDNKLCNSKKDGSGELIRGPCAIVPYDIEECGEVCLYDEIDKRFPRVTICDNGKYCCDNDKKCCDEGRGVLLNSAGKLVGKAASTSTDSVPSTTSILAEPESTSDSSPSTSDSSPSASDPATTSSSTPTPSATSETTVGAAQSAASSSPTAAGGLATGAKIGIGVAVPVAVLGAAALGAFLWFRRRRVYSPAGKGEYKPSQAHELGATESPQEMQAYPIEQSNIPIELPAEEVPGMQPAKVDYKPYVRGE
ncbi:hypothetical protein VE03_06624 [Pseudogymnoascus sp. 23342-1-I1]|nr:hypothetical protein VE03_06624 [Pseudogymnoascus sp. 23342-1-I1]